MPLTFTKHARTRMEEREISMAEVYRVLAYGVYRNHFGQRIWSPNLHKIADDYWRKALKNLRVVCTMDLCVVTVFRQQEQLRYNF